MKEKRYINRNPYSIEDSLKDIIEKIGDKGLKEATGKGKDTFLKKSNPEHPGRHIDLKDAVDLDVYCRKNGLKWRKLSDEHRRSVFSIEMLDIERQFNPGGAPA